MYLLPRFYIAAAVVILVCGMGFAYLPLYHLGRIMLCLLLFAVATDIVLLYAKRGIEAQRHCGERLSNGDENPITLSFTNRYPFSVHLELTDEIPIIFQRRDICFPTRIAAQSNGTLTYTLCPTKRGAYIFGYLRVFAATPLQLGQRRYTCAKPQVVKVYPGYKQLQHYELLAISNTLSEQGVKRIRRVGNHTEFEQIKDYVKGDEYRSINWKASARRAQLMVNIYQDERSQRIYSVIDKGRVMQQAFEGMTLLDYAINASLVLSYVAMHKEDKAGLVTFANRVETMLPASSRKQQMQRLQDCLYDERNTFGESDFSALCVSVNRHIGKRSLLVLYTNFLNIRALERQLPYIIQLSHRHRLLVVFFEDVEMEKLAARKPRNTAEYYTQVMAEKAQYEKRLIVKRLKQHGILSLLTPPNQLNVSVVNRYLELKKQNMLI